MSNSLCLAQQRDINGAWDPPVTLGGPAVQVTGGQNGDGRLEVFWTDEQNNIMHTWQTSPGGKWAGQAPFGGQAKQLLAITDQRNRLTLIYIGMDNRVYINWLDTNGWQRSDLGSTQAKQITVNKNAPGGNGGGRLELLFIGLTDNFIYNSAQQAGTLDWTVPWKTAWAAKQIVLGKNGDGRLEFFYVGLTNSIYHGWQPVAGAGPWQENQLSGEAQTIVAGNNTDGTISIFYIGLDGNIYHNTQSRNGWGGELRAFQGVFYQGGARALSLSRNQDGRLQLFYEGTDGFTYSTWQNTPNGPYVGGDRGNSASAFSSLTDQDGRISLFYIGTPDAPPPPSTITLNFDPIVFPTGVQVGGNASLVLQQDGQYDLKGHFHHSEGLGTEATASLAFGLKDDTNAILIFRRLGKTMANVEDDDFNNFGTSSAITAAWPNLVPSVHWAAHATVQYGKAGATNSVLSDLGSPQGPVTVVYDD